MRDRYVQPSKVETGIMNLIGDYLQDYAKRGVFLEKGEHRFMLNTSHPISNYDSGTIDVKPVEYKGKVCFVVDFTLFDYSLYDTHFPYAKGIGGAYLIDEEARILAITEDTTIGQDCEDFPWSVAHRRCRDYSLKEIIDEPAIFIKTAGKDIDKKAAKKKPTKAVRYLRNILSKKKDMDTKEGSIDVEGSVRRLSIALSKGRDRSIAHIDHEIQEKIDTMEDIIDSVLGGRSFN